MVSLLPLKRKLHEDRTLSVFTAGAWSPGCWYVWKSNTYMCYKYQRMLGGGRLGSHYLAERQGRRGAPELSRPHGQRRGHSGYGEAKPSWRDFTSSSVSFW